MKLLTGLGYQSNVLAFGILLIGTYVYERYSWCALRAPCFLRKFRTPVLSRFPDIIEKNGKAIESWLQELSDPNEHIIAIKICFHFLFI